MDDKNTAYLAALAGQGPAPTPVTRDEALLNAIIDRLAAIEEGGGLPDVAADDNGDVLTVVNGAWGKAAPSGGGESVVIHFSSGEGNVMTADKTYSEIAEIFSSGATIWVDLSGWDDTLTGEYLVTKKDSAQMDAVSLLAMDFVSVQNNTVRVASIASFSDGTFDIARLPT